MGLASMSIIQEISMKVIGSNHINGILGEWELGKRSGYGKYHYGATGNAYEGYWKNHLPNGMGKEFFADGSKFQGIINLNSLFSRKLC